MSEIHSEQIVENLEERLNKAKKHNQQVKKVPIDLLLEFFDSLVNHWITDKERRFLNQFSQFGIIFY